MQEMIEVITPEALREERKSEKTAEEAELRREDTEAEEPDHLLRVQLFVCIFLAAVLYFAWKQGGELWRELSFALEHILEDGISFSGQEELTRFTDEVTGFWGELSRSAARLFR